MLLSRMIYFNTGMMMNSINQSTIYHLFFLLLLRAVATRGLGIQRGLEECYCIILWKKMESE